MIKKLWKDIKIGDKFSDGSKVLSVHDEYIEECFLLTYIIKYDFKEIVLSSTHPLLCKLDTLSDNAKRWIMKNFSGYSIPTLADKHIWININTESKSGLENAALEIKRNNNKNDFKYINTTVRSDPAYISNINSIWLPMKAIHFLLERGEIIYCNNSRLLNSKCVGNKTVKCVETDSHKFEMNGLIHHNSVTLRNVIFHCLTHSYNISIALIDLKYTEFTPYKDVNGVVAVANTVKETAEIMRIAKECMYKRNQEMAKIGINDIKDYKPQKPTNEVMIFNRKFTDDEIVEVKLTNGEIKQMTIKELEDLLK